MIPVYIMDTSYLLVLNEIPSRFDNKDDVAEVKGTMNFIKSASSPRIYITVPILLEYAGFIHRLMKGKKDIKYNHADRLNKDISSSLKDYFPWVIYGTDHKHGARRKHDEEQDKNKEFLLKIHDIVALSERFVDDVHIYSFADLSIIQAAEQLTEQFKKRREVKILTLEEKLRGYDTSRTDARSRNH